MKNCRRYRTTPSRLILTSRKKCKTSDNKGPGNDELSISRICKTNNPKCDNRE